jgi:hypothetical protein
MHNSNRPSINYNDVKQRVSLEDVAQMLGLQLKKDGSGFRCACPAHSGGDRTLVVTPGKGFYCQGEKKGGDQIQLYAHVMKCTNYEAAETILRNIGDSPEAKEAPSPAHKAEPDGRRESLQPLDYLVTSHPVAELLGLSAATLEALGGRYAPRGSMTGRILIPLRMDDGRLVGYLGIATSEDQEPLLRFPKNLEERCTSAKSEPKPEAAQPDQLRKLFRVVS